MTSLQSIQEALDRQFYWKFRGTGFLAVCGGVSAISGLCTMPNSYPGQKPTYINGSIYDPNSISPEQDAINLRNFQIASTSFKVGISGAVICGIAICLLIYYNQMYDKEFERRASRIAPAPVQPVVQAVSPPSQNPQAPAKTNVLVPAPIPAATPMAAEPIEIEEEETSVKYVQPKITPSIPPRAPVRSILKTGAPPLVVNRQNIPAQILMPTQPPQFQPQHYQPPPPVRYNNYSLETYRVPHYVPRAQVYAPYNGSYALQPQQSYEPR
jgi:hypothetical protein